MRDLLQTPTSDLSIYCKLASCREERQSTVKITGLSIGLSVLITTEQKL